MASGLAALLDDVAAIAKLAAASLDDVTAAAGKAGAKAAGVVVDDAAVTPGYAMGFAPERELPIVWKIALGSLRNKFLFLLPGALLLSAFAPWAVTPILMLGGTYLCFEAAEKIIEAAFHASSHDAATAIAQPTPDSAQLEARKVAGAIRTDFILSGEIMAIALATVADRPLAIQAGALATVGFVLTIAVYGVVGLIVKMDDVGVHLARRDTAAARLTGRGLVKSMPYVLDVLSVVGTAAMLWVGGGIIVHGLEHFGLNAIPHFIDSVSERVAHATGLGAAIRWSTFAVCSAIAGFVIGSVIVAIANLAHRRKH
jgi:predicted DNA repair protein MutK